MYSFWDWCEILFRPLSKWFCIKLRFFPDSSLSIWKLMRSVRYSQDGSGILLRWFFFFFFFFFFSPLFDLIWDSPVMHSFWIVEIFFCYPLQDDLYSFEIGFIMILHGFFGGWLCIDMRLICILSAFLNGYFEMHILFRFFCGATRFFPTCFEISRHFSSLLI